MLAYVFGLVLHSAEGGERKMWQSYEYCFCSHEQFTLYYTVLCAITDLLLFLHVCLMVSELVLAYAGEYVVMLLNCVNYSSSVVTNDMWRWWWWWKWLWWWWGGEEKVEEEKGI